jgi:hypothetical protein
MSNRQTVPTIPPLTVSAAEAAIANLTAKRDALVERGDQLATNRASVAYKALHDDDPTAKAALERIGKESVEHDHALASVDAALATGKQKLEAAKRHEAKQADRANAKRLRECLAAFKESARTLDATLEVLIAGGGTMRQLITEMNRLGLTHPSHNQLDTLGGIALRSALMNTPWQRHFERVGPMEQKTFAVLMQSWSPMIERHIAALEQTNEPEAA